MHSQQAVSSIYFQVVPLALIEALFNACYSSSYDQLEGNVRELLVEGYSASQVLLQLHDMLVPVTTITDVQKSEIAERMGVSQFYYLCIVSFGYRYRL